MPDIVSSHGRKVIQQLPLPIRKNRKNTHFIISHCGLQFYSVHDNASRNGKSKSDTMKKLTTTEMFKIHEIFMMTIFQNVLKPRIV